MTAPKPIAIEVVEDGDYSGPAPQPYVVVGGTLQDILDRLDALEDAAGSPNP